MSVGGVDTYYDYDERRWKFRRLGGGPVHTARVCPSPPEAADTDRTDRTDRTRPASVRGTTESRTARVRAGED
ncbi:hypothetical protein OHA10_33100 [Kribbella sp. NBC_00662]|uniref:hypothetical protein n=1 Tax=Kribbella sp. NBC_00662 TaxID=2975969 RepID=UPI00324B44E8